jgi:hypothetical protein
MDKPLGMNRRHKAGLSLTLVTAGTLLLNAKPPQMGWFAIKAAGVMLIGLALTWFFGGLARRPGLVFSAVLLCIGMLIAIFPVWRDWHSYGMALRDFEAARAVLLANKSPSAWDVLWCQASLDIALEKASRAYEPHSSASDCYRPPHISFAWTA